MGSSTENSIYGESRNPWDPEPACGGSSGGSAAASPWRPASSPSRSAATPAARSGSRRASAASSGLKPTYGRVSRWGLVAFASSLDQIGPFGRTVEDCAALALELIAGHDPRDSTSVPEPAPSLCERARRRRLRARDRPAARVFRRGGRRPRRARASARGDRRARERRRQDVSCRGLAPAYGAYTIADLLPDRDGRGLEQPRALRRRPVRHRAERPEDGLTDLYERSRSEGFGREVKRRILLGTYVLSAGYYDAYYGKAQRVRTLIRRDFERGVRRVRSDSDADDAGYGFSARREAPTTRSRCTCRTSIRRRRTSPACRPLSVPCGRCRGVARRTRS